MEKRKKTNQTQNKTNSPSPAGVGKPSDVLIYPIISNVASGNETTGMMPTPPMTRDAYNSFRILSSMELPEVQPETWPGDDGE